MKQVLALFLLLSLTTHSQNDKFNWTESASAPTNYAKIYKHLGTDGQSHFVAWKGSATPNNPFDFWIQEISHDSQETSLVSFSFIRRNTNTPKPIVFKELYRLGGKNYITYTEYDKKAGLNALKIQEIKSDGSKGEPVQLANLEPTGLLNRGDYYLALSPDQSKLIVLGYDGYRRKVETQFINLTCVNTTDMSIMWTKELTLPTNSQKLMSYTLTADNDGNCVFYNRFKDGKEGYKSSIFGYNVEDDLLTDFDTKLIGEQFVQTHKLEVNDLGEFSFNGLYRDAGILPNGNVVHGRVYMKISKAKELIASYTGSFTEELFNAAESEDLYLLSVQLVNVHNRTDGKSILMIEKTSGLKEVIPGTNPVAYETFSVREDILAICLDSKTGETSWVTKIPKYQKLSDSKFPNAKDEVSFVSILVGKKVHILYNNTSVNTNWKENDGSDFNKTQVFGSNVGRPVFQYVLEENGSLTYSDLKHGMPLKGLFNVDNRYPLTMNPKLCVVLEDTLFLGATYNGINYRYCAINLN